MLAKRPFTAESAFKLLSARLHGVRGFTGRGVVKYVIWPSGGRRMVISLKGLAGISVELYVNDRLIRRLAVSNGVARMVCSTRRGGETPPIIEAGDIVEFRQNGDPVLAGALAPDTRLKAARRTLRRLWILWKISWRARPQFLRIFDRPD